MVRLYAISVFFKTGPSKALQKKASYELSSFGFFQRSSVREFMAFTSEVLAERTEVGERRTVKEQEYRCHVYVRSDSLACVVIADEDYPPRVIFTLMSKDDSECPEVILDDDEMPIEHAKSTKQPTQGAKKPAKRARLENTENDLLEKAIKCIDQATVGSEVTVDSAELFGRYVASELRAMNPQSQRWVKLQIKKTLFNAAQSETSVPFSQPTMDPFYQPYPGPRQSHSFIHTPI